jgi:hypothetical protein
MVLFEWTLTDARGRTVASTLLAVCVRNAARHIWTIAELDAIAEMLGRTTSAESWRTEAVRRHTRFWQCRFDRHHAIGERLAGRAVLLQPGLFDRRAIDSHQQAAADRDVQQATIDAQLLLATQALAQTKTAIVPVLVLTA